jgi:hypothetical protein
VESDKVRRFAVPQSRRAGNHQLHETVSTVGCEVN